MAFIFCLGILLIMIQCFEDDLRESIESTLRSASRTTKISKRAKKKLTKDQRKEGHDKLNQVCQKIYQEAKKGKLHTEVWICYQYKSTVDYLVKKLAYKGYRVHAQKDEIGNHCTVRVGWGNYLEDLEDTNNGN